MDFALNKLSENLKQALLAIIQSCNPEKIILYGSHARGDADAQSDVDLLIIEKDVLDVGHEMVKISRLISPFAVPSDILVASKNHFDYWRDTPGNVYFEAASEGKLLFEKAS